MIRSLRFLVAMFGWSAAAMCLAGCDRENRQVTPDGRLTFDDVVEQADQETSVGSEDDL